MVLGIWDDIYSPFHGRMVPVERIFDVGSGQTKKTVLYVAPGPASEMDMFVYTCDGALSEQSTLSVVEILHRVLFPAVGGRLRCKRIAPMASSSLVGMDRSWR